MKGPPFKIPGKTRLLWLAFETTSKRKDAQESTEKEGNKLLALGDAMHAIGSTAWFRHLARIEMFTRCRFEHPIQKI